MTRITLLLTMLATVAGGCVNPFAKPQAARPVEATRAPEAWVVGQELPPGADVKAGMFESTALSSPEPTPADAAPGGAASGQLDPVSIARTASHVEVWLISVPQGTVSRDEAFWKRIDETAVDVATYDLLFKNGVRVGTAPVSEWGYFRDLLSRHPAISKQGGATIRDEMTMTIDVAKDIETQTIFHLDAANTPIGRTFDECDNQLAITFQPAPRRGDAVRVAVCPVVKSRRTRLEYTQQGTEREVVTVKPERLYQLNLISDVRYGQFLVLAPSSESIHLTSLGRAFFVEDKAAERMERVILIVPRELHLTNEEEVRRALQRR